MTLLGATSTTGVRHSSSSWPCLRTTRRPPPSASFGCSITSNAIFERRGSLRASSHALHTGTGEFKALTMDGCHSQFNTFTMDGVGFMKIA